MGLRQDLHDLFKTLLGSNFVYFQPPATLEMTYPCIVYRRDNMVSKFADDAPYNTRTRYQVIYIDRNPDSEIPAKIAELPTCVYDRFYTAENLNHDSFKLFF